MATPATSRNHFPPPEPTSLERLTRPQVAARVATLRSALDLVAGQSDLDGGAVFECTGSMKACLIRLEQHLRDLDRSAPAVPFAAAVNNPAACARVRVADLNRKECEQGRSHAEHIELADLARTIAVAGAVSLAGGAR